MRRSNHPSSGLGLGHRARRPVQSGPIKRPLVDHAANVVSLAGVHIVLLHVLELPRMHINPEIFDALQGFQTDLERRRQAALEWLEQLCRKFRTLGVECEARMRAGVPHEEILTAGGSRLKNQTEPFSFPRDLGPRPYQELRRNFRRPGYFV
jgi:hypothetical protein